MRLVKILHDVNEVCRLIDEEKQIIAIFQGESEWGPRALGNRSILFDPRNPNAKNIVNIIKKREFYRPFAGSILEEYAHDWFEMGTLDSSPYMSFAIQAKEIAYREIPALVHSDGTCRIQTVNQEQNPNYYNLIRVWHERTGCPIIFNTSFNLHGDPIVETIEDAIHSCNNCDINYLYVPEDQDIHLPINLIKDKDEKREDNTETFGR